MELRREDAERVALAGGEPARELLLALFDRVAEQGELLEKIERRLGQNSRNSSLPPSSDRGQAPKRPARKKSERRQGGQAGHEGRSRQLVDDPDAGGFRTAREWGSRRGDRSTRRRRGGAPDPGPRRDGP